MSGTNHTSPVEDGRSSVSGEGRREMSTGTKLGLLGLLAVIAIAFIWFNASLGQRRTQKAEPTAYASGGQAFEPPPATAPKTPSATATLPTPPFQSTAFPSVDSNQVSPASAPIMAFSGSPDIMPSISTVGAPASPTTGEASLNLSGSDRTPLASRLKATLLDGTKASLIDNPDMVVTEGTMIPCVLQTAINSELPGLVTCVVPIDVRGTTGNVVLLDRGTRIVGQIQSGLMQGQDRVFVDWTRAETPDHVIVALDSPGSDELGRAGLPGAVDNHLWQRFGGALMLTLVQGALDAATVEAAGSGGGSSTSQEAGLGFVYAGQSNGQTIANTALLNTINIAPTLSKNQGDTVSLIVAHDMDFSDVYSLQVENGGSASGG
jgi:type IV secretion system protein VirB10